MDTHLDGFVRTTSDQPRPRHVERRAEHSRLRLQRPRLRHVVHVLERGARVPVPERERAVVAAGEEDRKSTRLNSSHSGESRMPSSA